MVYECDAVYACTYFGKIRDESWVYKTKDDDYVLFDFKEYPSFFEEVKETPKPKYRVGDYAVDCEKRFVKIFSVSKNDDPRMYNEVYTGQWYFWILERDLRDPTEEELSIYFR